MATMEISERGDQPQTVHRMRGPEGWWLLPCSGSRSTTTDDLSSEDGTTCPAIMAQVGCTRADSGVAWLLGNLVLEVLLRVAGHDQQAAMRQPLRKCDGAVFSPEPEQAPRTQADRGDCGPHFRFIIRMEPNAAVSILVQVAEHGVVSRPRHTRVGIGRQGSGFFYSEFRKEQFRYPRQRRIQPPGVCVVGSRIALVGFLARDGMSKRGFAPLPRALPQQGSEQIGCFLRRKEMPVHGRANLGVPWPWLASCCLARKQNLHGTGIPTWRDSEPHQD